YIKPTYFQTWPFEEGMAAVEIDNPGRGRVGFINKKGQLIIPTVYGIGFRFREGRAWVGWPGEYNYFLIDTRGRRLTQPSFITTGDFSEGLAAASVFVGKNNDVLTGYVNASGRFVIQPQFDLPGDFSEGLAKARKLGGKWGYIDKTGAWAIQPQFD